MSARPTQTLVCTAILVTTLLAKVALLSSTPSRLLSAVFPGLNLAVKDLVLLGACLEAGVLVAGALLGRRTLLLGSFALGSLFLAFHGFLAFGGIQTPCKCLGALTQFSPWLAQNEAGVSVLLCLALVAASSLGLCPDREPAKEDTSWAPSLVAGGLWFAAGAWVIIGAGSRNLGGDEGMELSKALLLHRDPALFADAWNDQSPIFPWLIARLWDVTGFSVPAARWLSLTLGTLLPIAAALALRPWGLSCAASMLGPGLLLQPDVALNLGSAMMETPAFGLGAAAVIPLVLLRQRPLTAFALSVLLASFALVFKATAAFGLLLLLAHLHPREWLRYGVGILVGFSALSFGSGHDIVMSATSHSFSGPDAQRHALDVYGLVFSAPGFVGSCILGAAAGCFYGPRKLVLGLLGACSLSVLIHLIHRPFWSYYAVHMAAPMVLLAGVGFFSVVRHGNLGAVVASAVVLCSTWIMTAPAVPSSFRSGAPVESRAAYLLQQQSGAIRRILSEDPWAPVSIGITPLPESMIIPAKRVWIGDWSPAHAARAVIERKPDLVALYPQTSTNRFVIEVLRPFRIVGTYQGFTVFVRTNFPPVELPRNDLKTLGL